MREETRFILTLQNSDVWNVRRAGKIENLRAKFRRAQERIQRIALKDPDPPIDFFQGEIASP